MHKKEQFRIQLKFKYFRAYSHQAKALLAKMLGGNTLILIAPFTSSNTTSGNFHSRCEHNIDLNREQIEQRHCFQIHAHALEFFTNTQSWQCWHHCQLCIPCIWSFSLYLLQLMLVNVKLEIKRGMRIPCQGYTFYRTSWFLMAGPKQSWQCWHFCIARSLWKTLLI